MSIFPLITEEKQNLYETIYSNNQSLENTVPNICGYYGRACRNMGEMANSMLCTHCSLSTFCSTAEAILEKCKEKESMGIDHLYDSDICEIQALLKTKCIEVPYSYIEKLLEELTS